MRYGKHILSIALTITFILSSLNVLTLNVPSKVSAFPTYTPQPSEYIFYDDFEAHLANWTVPSNNPKISTAHAYHGTHSLYFDATNGTQEIDQNFWTAKNHVMVEIQFYDDSSDASAIAELFVKNATGNVRLGVRTATSASFLEVRNYISIGSPLSILRQTAWVDLKILVQIGYVELYIDNNMVGTADLTNATGYGFQMASAAPINVYVDQFLVYNFWQDSLWNRPVSSSQPADYQFADDFEANLNSWAVTGTPVISTAHAQHGTHAVFFSQAASGNQQIQRNIGTFKTNITLECWFYDNKTDNSALGEMYVYNASSNIRLGVRTTTTGDKLEYRMASGHATTYPRGNGWVNLKIQLKSGMAYFYANDTLLGSGAFRDPINYGFSMSALPLDCYVDQFYVYPTPAVDLNKTWSAQTVAEPNVIYEGGIWKMWYRGAQGPPAYTHGVGYATSTDGITWTQYAANPVTSIDSWCPTVHKIGSTYYLYYSGNYSGYWTILRKTSADGITWSVSTPTLVQTRGTWDGTYIGNNDFWVEGSTWYMLYEASGVGSASWEIGYATSPDGITWTKYAGNPVISGPGARGGPQVFIVDGTYYCFLHYADYSSAPTDIVLMQSTDKITWTASSFFSQLPKSFDRSLEHLQVADPFVVAFNTSSYLYYCGSSDGTDGHIFLAKSNYNLSQLVNGNILQWGPHMIGDIGVTNNVTTSGRYWYSGINAMKGTYTDNLSLSTTSDIKITITDMSSQSIGWTADPGILNPTVTFALSGLENAAQYYVEVDGGRISQLTADASGQISFTYSGPWSEHAFEVAKTIIQESVDMITSVVPALVGLAVLSAIIGMVSTIFEPMIIVARDRKGPRRRR
jgi:hypothetical protein